MRRVYLKVGYNVSMSALVSLENETWPDLVRIVFPGASTSLVHDLLMCHTAYPFSKDRSRYISDLTLVKKMGRGAHSRMLSRQTCAVMAMARVGEMFQRRGLAIAFKWTDGWDQPELLLQPHHDTLEEFTAFAEARGYNVQLEWIDPRTIEQEKEMEARKAENRARLKAQAESKS